MCAITGAFGVDNASYVVSLMLKAMQHRGQEAAGIVSFDQGRVHEIRGFGLVDEVFGGVDIAAKLPGRAAVGHVRYSTSGDPDSPDSIQPLVATIRGVPTAIVHNGNLTNYAEMRASLEELGAIFRSRSDTETFLHLMARADAASTVERLRAAFARAEGAWSVLVLDPGGIVAAVDPLGFRPLAVAPYQGGFVYASETCAFDLLAARPWTQVPPGRIIAESGGHASEFAYADAPVRRQCSFEHIYFSRPDSDAFGVSSNEVRERLGALLAKNHGIRTDLVTPVPDSSNAMAIAYAEALGVPYRKALIRNHYTGRTFITPKQTAREHGVRMKLNAVRHLVSGKTVTMVDDSLVRGTTASKVVALLRDAGAREVHVRIGSPPVIHPCFWGIDTPSRKELAASAMSVDALREKLGADSLEYLTPDELRLALGDVAGARYCATCFTGVHPEHGIDVPIPLVLRKDRSK